MKRVREESYESSSASDDDDKIHECSRVEVTWGVDDAEIKSQHLEVARVRLEKHQMGVKLGIQAYYLIQ